MNKFKTTQSTHPKMMVWTDPETGIQRFNPIESKVTLQELKKKLWAHLYVNHPEFTLELKEDKLLEPYLEKKIQSVSDYLDSLLSESKPDYVVEELCLTKLLDEIRPARFPYFLQVLAEQFPEIYQIWQQQGILTVQIINFKRYLRSQFKSLDQLFEGESKERIYETVTQQFSAFFHTQKNLLQRPEGFWDTER
jgi:hypothetical protein